MAATDAKPVPIKNAAYRITFPIYDADGDLVTGATGLDSEVSKDGGTFADCTNEATEIATSSGMYYLDLTSTEMNADTVAIIVKTSTSGAKTTVVVLNPQEAGDIKVDVETISDDATAATNAEAFFDGTGYAGTNNVIPTVTTLTNGVNVTQISGDSIAADNLEAALDGTGGVTITAGLTGNVTGNLSGSVGSVTSGVTVSTNNDKTGYVLSSGGLANISAWTVAITGNITGNLSGSVGSISGVTFPTNFGALAITAGGVVDADLETIKGQAVTCSAGVTIGVYVGGTAAAATATALASIDGKLGTIVDVGGGATIGANLDHINGQVDTAVTVLNSLGLNGSGMSAIPWNAAWDAEVQSECADALAAYDPPTNAEMEARTLLAASYATASNLATVAGYLDTEIAAILEDTGTTIPAQIAALSIPSAASNASAVRTELATELARIDVATSTRLATASYTSPLDAAGVRAAVGLASANLDTQIGDVPTVAEFEARTLAAASYATASVLSTVASNVVLVLADTGADGVALSAATCNKIADHVRRRNQENVEASSDGDTLSLLSEYGFIQMAQESAASGTTLTVKKTDGTTTLGTRTLATDAAADPVTGVS